MEKKEFGYNPREAPLEFLKTVIKNADEKIRAEYARSGNTWMQCFGSIVTVLYGWMQLRKSKLEEALSPDGYRAAMTKLAALEKRLKELKEQYQRKELDPSDEIKEELLREANILGQ